MSLRKYTHYARLSSRRRTIELANSRKITDYKKFKQPLRWDFHHTCGFCGIWESQLGGQDHFSVEHFFPKDPNPSLECEPTNLLYACIPCNRFKWKTSPVDPEGMGNDFLDPCIVNYSQHFEVRDDKLVALSAPARFMIDKLRLNNDKAIKYRKQRRLSVEYVHRILDIRPRLRKLELCAKSMSSEKRELVDDLREFLDASSDYVKSVLPRKLDS